MHAHRDPSQGCPILPPRRHLSCKVCGAAAHRVIGQCHYFASWPAVIQFCRGEWGNLQPIQNKEMQPTVMEHRPTSRIKRPSFRSDVLSFELTVDRADSPLNIDFWFIFLFGFRTFFFREHSQILHEFTMCNISQQRANVERPVVFFFARRWPWAPFQAVVFISIPRCLFRLQATRRSLYCVPWIAVFPENVLKDRKNHAYSTVMNTFSMVSMAMGWFYTFPLKKTTICCYKKGAVEMPSTFHGPLWGSTTCLRVWFYHHWNDHILGERFPVFSSRSMCFGLIQPSFLFWTKNRMIPPMTVLVSYKWQRQRRHFSKKPYKGERLAKRIISCYVMPVYR